MQGRRDGARCGEDRCTEGRGAGRPSPGMRPFLCLEVSTVHDFLMLRDEMAALKNVTYLNWGGSGPSPRRVVEAEIRAIHALNDEHGPMSATALAHAAGLLAG